MRGWLDRRPVVWYGSGGRRLASGGVVFVNAARLPRTLASCQGFLEVVPANAGAAFFFRREGGGLATAPPVRLPIGSWGGECDRLHDTTDGGRLPRRIAHATEWIPDAGSPGQQQDANTRSAGRVGPPGRLRAAYGTFTHAWRGMEARRKQWIATNSRSHYRPKARPEAEPFEPGPVSG